MNALLDFGYKPISPAREMGAYEALWDEEGASVKTLAEKFRSSPEALPSDFVADHVVENYKSRLLRMLRDARVENFGIRINGTADYLTKLRDAKHPIELFYFQGNWDLASSRSVAIVGSRNPSDEGLRRARKLAWHLVEDDFTVVSGLAKGIDTAAHKAALEFKGRTMAVLGTPLTENYPKDNRALQTELAREFLVVSQVPFIRYSKQNPRTNRFFFPERNKLMSALTEATIIVEAGETSGTLVQARAALEQGRKLFILESCFQNPNLSWPSRLEKKGAIRVRDYADISEVLNP